MHGDRQEEEGRDREDILKEFFFTYQSSILEGEKSFVGILYTHFMRGIIFNFSYPWPVV